MKINLRIFNYVLSIALELKKMSNNLDIKTITLSGSTLPLNYLPSDWKETSILVKSPVPQKGEAIKVDLYPVSRVSIRPKGKTNRKKTRK
jgi:hypothetical protein